MVRNWRGRYQVRGGMASWRTIRESPRYTEERDAIFADNRDADEVVRDVTNSIACDPRIGQQIEDTPVWAVPVDESPVSPDITIYYTWDDDFVTLESMQESEVEEVIV